MSAPSATSLAHSRPPTAAIARRGRWSNVRAVVGGKDDRLRSMGGPAVEYGGERTPTAVRGRCYDVLIAARALQIGSRAELAALAVALGAADVAGWSEEERALVRDLPPADPVLAATTVEAIRRGDDPLGDAFCRLLSPEQRRPLGATYTPNAIVAAMTAWAAAQPRPARIVDPGAGSGRFLVAAGRAFPDAHLVASELDPAAAILARGHLAAAGLAPRAEVVVGDYRELHLPRIAGRTLFIGNPPYVRHHLLEPRWKAWLVAAAREYGLAASQLAGLHVYFFLATARHARPGDLGAFITAAEWLDVNYGQLVRDLLLGPLGGKTIHVIEPAAKPFPDAATTAVITGFEVGARPPTIGLRRVASLNDLDSLNAGEQVDRERFETSARWTLLTRTPTEKREGFVELGELCRVHRGQATGANSIWIRNRQSVKLPDSVMFPSITRARELLNSEGVLRDASRLKLVIDLPVDLSVFSEEERRQVDEFLHLAKACGADRGFLARHRKAWWSVGLREPAPILVTYMARRPPVFVRNLASARHINIAHGLYPRETLDEPILLALVRFLSYSVSTDQGRTYMGGLTKFEPKEMEHLLVPSPELLLSEFDLVSGTSTLL